MSEIQLSQVAKDDLADIVLERYREAFYWKESHVVYMEKSATDLFNQAHMQLTREYSSTQKQMLQDVFGNIINFKYDSITQEKVEAVTDWYSDLFVSSMDKVFTITPSPDPTLDKASVDRIHEEVEQDLLQKIKEMELQDPSLLLNADGTPSGSLQKFLDKSMAQMAKVEKTRIMALAQEACERAQIKMRDIIVEGDFRRAFTEFTHDRFLYGIAIMKFPDWQRKRVIKHSGKRAKPAFELVPTFRRVFVNDFFPSPDALRDLQTCLGVTERRLVTKIDLINLANQSNYNSTAIIGILDEFQNTPRSWLPSSMDMKADWPETNWTPDQEITVLIHEGYFTGSELKKAGIPTKVKATEYVTAHVEICGGRTIRCEVSKAPYGLERTYFGAPLSLVGNTFWDTIGVAAKVSNTESRVNLLMHTALENLEWASKPPLMVNANVFANAQDADNIMPGKTYKVNDLFGQTGNMPEPIRPMNPISAQYHLILSEAANLKKMADDASGIPAYAYGGAEYGSASLGEFAQRMSNALRTVKGAARKEDEYFTEPAFTALFRYLCEKYPEFDVGQDFDCEIRGMAGLLGQSQKQSQLQQAVPLAIQGLQMGLINPEVAKLTIRSALEDMGVPINQIDPDDDPIINSIMGAAASNSQQTEAPADNQIPSLDGRSNAAQATTAAPDGASPQITGEIA